MVGWDVYILTILGWYNFVSGGGCGGDGGGGGGGVCVCVWGGGMMIMNTKFNGEFGTFKCFDLQKRERQKLKNKRKEKKGEGVS